MTLYEWELCSTILHCFTDLTIGKCLAAKVLSNYLFTIMLYIPPRTVMLGNLFCHWNIFILQKKKIAYVAIDFYYQRFVHSNNPVKDALISSKDENLLLNLLKKIVLNKFTLTTAAMTGFGSLYYYCLDQRGKRKLLLNISGFGRFLR